MINDLYMVIFPSFHMRKKILCWFTLDFTQFFVVNRLSKLMDADFYAIYDLPDKTAEFFKEQHITDFKKSWFFHYFPKIYVFPGSPKAKEHTKIYFHNI